MQFFARDKSEIVLGVLPIFLCIAWQFMVGKDLNWDASNYHLYAGFSALNERLSQDFFAAGPQSYLNPFAYTLFYLLVTYFESALVIGLVLALSHSAVIYLTWGIAKLVLKEMAPSKSFLFLTTILSLSTTVVWHQIGSSFIDIYVTILVLLGVYCLLRYNISPNAKLSFISAFVLGCAVGIKLTSGMFAIAAAGCAFFLMCLKHKEYKHFMWFAMAGVAGTLLVEGWWGYKVYQQTGNPFFPFLNSIFCSPYVICESIAHHRFIPSSLLEALILPFEMVLPSPWLYIEILSPDARFALFFLSFPFLAYLRKRNKKNTSSFSIVLSFWLISYCLWIVSTGNGRYGMPLFILIGVILGYMISKALDAKRSQIYMFLLVVFQMCLIGFGGEFRWNSVAWGDSYFEYKLPVGLTSTPALYVSTEYQSNSFLIPQYHRDSSFISISGQMPLDGEDAFGKIKQLLNRHEGNLRFFTEIEIPEDRQVSDVNWHSLIDTKLERFGWKIDEQECEYVKNVIRKGILGEKYIVDCPIKTDAVLASEFKESVSEVNIIFRNIEKLCPQLFSPSEGVTEKVAGAWLRYYIGSDTTILVMNTDVVKQDYTEIGTVILGKREEWLNNPEAASLGCKTSGTKRSRSVSF